MGGLGTGLSLHNIFCPRSAQILSKACNAGKEHEPVRYACTTLARVLMAHTEWLPGVWLRHFCTTLALHIEDCDGVGGCPVVIAQWQSTDCTSQVSWVGFLATAILFHFPLSCLNILENLFLSGVSKSQSWNFTTKFEWKFSTVEDFSKCSDQ